MSQPVFTKIASFKVDFSPRARTSFMIPGKQGETYRFVDVSTFVQQQTLDVYMTTVIPQNTYACISYPWSGLQRNQDDAVIDVAGLEKRKEANAISVPMLNIACTAALKLDVKYLWLDKLSFRQDEPDDDSPDKLFQMKNMYSVYEKCKVCLVFAGGMSRLPKIDERTTWIDRAWTLQEALAPPDVRVLFEWTLGPKRLRPLLIYEESKAKPVPVEQPMEGVGMSGLKRFLECSVTSANEVLPAEDIPVSKEDEDGILVGFLHSETGQPDAVMRLLGAMICTDDSGKLNAIWRCLILRQARYKEDLIFSSMGIMKVNVIKDGIGRGTNYNDIEVMDLVIRLIKELIKKGSRAEWLGISPLCGPAPGYSSLPNMPLERSVGHGYYKDEKTSLIWPIGEAYDDNWWWLRGSPMCSVQENADVSFTTKAVPVELAKEQKLPGDDKPQKDHPDRLIQSLTGQAWVIRPDMDSHKADEKPPYLPQSALYAVYVGTKVSYVTDLFENVAGTDTTLLMIVEQSEPGRYRNVAYVYGDENLTKDWVDITFRIGG